MKKIKFFILKYLNVCAEKKIQVLAEVAYDLPKTLSFHKEKSVSISVDLIRFDCSKKNEEKQPVS